MSRRLARSCGSSPGLTCNSASHSDQLSGYLLCIIISLKSLTYSRCTRAGASRTRYPSKASLPSPFLALNSLTMRRPSSSVNTLSKYSLLVSPGGALASTAGLIPAHPITVRTASGSISFFESITFSCSCISPRSSSPVAIAILFTHRFACSTVSSSLLIRFAAASIIRVA